MASRVLREFPRETVTFVPLRNLGVIDPADIDVTLVKPHLRPTTWEPAVAQPSGEVGYVLDGPTLGRGVFTVYVRLMRDAGAEVVEHSQIRLT